jgi:FAD/FMN-containing dehydrogenase
MVRQADVGSLAELSEFVRTAQRLVIEGAGSGRPFDCVERSPNLQIAYRGVIAHDAADQVVSVRAGILIKELQEELKASGQCIPIGGPLAGTVGGRLSQNLPHGLEAICGSWRDWVLGLTVIRPDGTIAKAGSKAVKNVAGYDVQKLFVGARGTLGVVAEVILRTFPIKALPPVDFQSFRSDWPERGFIQRTLATDFLRACEAAGGDLRATHSLTSTLYRSASRRSDLPRFNDDWILGWGFGADNMSFDPALQTLMIRAKQIFDPTHKMNPGELNLI